MRKNPEKFEKEVKRNYKKYLIFIIFFIVVILTNIVTYNLGFNIRIKDTLSKFSLINPLRKFIGSSDMIINIQDLRDELSLIGEKDKNISIYFEFLNTGANIAVNKDAEFFPASLSKLPLAMAAAKKVERGEWKWSNELVLMPMDKDDRFGELYKKPIGTKFTVEELVKEMITNSDNTAYTILLRNLEKDEFDNTLKHLGLDSFFSQEGKISSKKYVVFLRSLYNSTYLETENSERILSFMSSSTTNNFLSKGIPKEVLFAHKIGLSKEQNVYLDAGIVYVPDRPYFIIVMINDVTEENAEKEMEKISKRVYNYIVNYK